MLKLLAHGPVLYWADTWNRFDVVVVVGSWVAMVIEVEGVQAARAFRAFRIALILKGPFGNSLRSLFSTLVMSVQPCINICLLLVLHFSLFSILAMQLFAPEENNKPEDWSTNLTLLTELGQLQQTTRSNFLSFSGAMRLLFECISGKDWKVVMFEIERYNSLAFWFFFLHYFFAVFILQNLFIGKHTFRGTRNDFTSESRRELTRDSFCHSNHCGRIHQDGA